jgi:hypothetical protein
MVKIHFQIEFFSNPKFIFYLLLTKTDYIKKEALILD